MELLACLFQTGHALGEVQGIGPAQAVRVPAAIELAAGLQAELGEDRLQIRCPSDAAHMLMALIGHRELEYFVVVYLDTSHRVIDREILYQRTLNSSLVRIAEVFRGAVRRNCASIMVSHNHPSGDPSPSPEDVALTRRLVEAGKVMEVEVLDHIVVGRTQYVSLRERGTGFA